VRHEQLRAAAASWPADHGEQFSEGAHDRLFDVTRVPGAPEFLRAGFLIRQGSGKR
jgi:hypothetical protein